MRHDQHPSRRIIDMEQEGNNHEGSATVGTMTFDGAVSHAREVASSIPGGIPFRMDAIEYATGRVETISAGTPGTRCHRMAFALGSGSHQVEGYSHTHWYATAAMMDEGICFLAANHRLWMDEPVLYHGEPDIDNDIDTDADDGWFGW